jgi:hypothetical protein
MTKKNSNISIISTNVKPRGNVVESNFSSFNPFKWNIFVLVMTHCDGLIYFSDRPVKDYQDNIDVI